MISSRNFRQLVGALAECLLRRDADDCTWLRSSFRNAVVASVALSSIVFSVESLSSSFGGEDDDFEMYFLLVLIASTRRDASVILTPGTGDSVGTRGAVAAALELIAAVPMPSSQQQH